MKVTITLTKEEIEKINELIGINNKNDNKEIADAIHTLIDVA